MTTPRRLDLALGEFAARPTVLIALDFDGTLAPLQVDPMASAPLPAGAAALEALAGLRGVNLALVSGRILRDLHELSHTPPGTYLIGSHGAERGRVGAGRSLTVEPLDLDMAHRTRLAAWRAELERIAAPVDGAWVEHKPVAEVLHTRPVHDPGLAEQTLALASAAGHRLGALVIAGHDVVELTATRVDKGEALNRLRRELSPDATLYAGDDVTDENAFAVLDAGDIGIRVGPGDTIAQFREPDPAALCADLTRVARLRAATSR